MPLPRNPARPPDPWVVEFPAFAVRLIPILSDNYAFVLMRDGRAAVVDPGDAGPVLDCLRRYQLRLCDIMVTHGHRDHVGGVEELRLATGARVTSPQGLSLPRVDQTVDEGSCIEWAGMPIQVWSTPGHLPVHVTYLEPGPAPAWAFVGDVLFGAGCGRLFGNPPALLHATHERMKPWPGACKLFCGHEFTLENLAFAQTVEPGNAALAARMERVRAQRAHNHPTVPLTLAEERETNPFLRCDQPEIGRRLGLPHADPLAVFTALRAAKDVF